MYEDTRIQERIGKLVADIKGLQPPLKKLSAVFREESNYDNPGSFDEWSQQDWCRAAFGDAMVRLRQLTEQNFQYIEIIGLLAVTRYIFEISVWLHLFKRDPTYGLVYYKKILDDQLRHYKNSVEQLRREVDLLKDFEQKDKQAVEAVLKKALSEGSLNSKYGTLTRQAMDAIDTEASLKFSLFFEDAKTNGYGFQAYLVESKAIPQAEQLIKEIEHKIADFQKFVPKKVKNMAEGKWNWRNSAEKVGLVNEYDYIYRYTSMLLHASPASLTTNQKNLELPEVYIFLRFIYSQIIEIMNLAQQQSECKP